MPDEPVETLPSGRPDRAQADAAFPRYQAEAEADPESWHAWMRLGIVYDACGDRKRARRSIREAISRYRN
jgi:Flp pilus assembly protein TadD